MPASHFNVQGLTSSEVSEARKKYGRNILYLKKENTVISELKNLVKEPMVLLLLTAAIIYMVNGKNDDAVFMIVSIFFVAGISLYQNARSRNALNQLKKFVQPLCKAIRNGERILIKSEDLVVGDNMIIEEGDLIMADGLILFSNDFSVNESILTGESYPVTKEATATGEHVYFGTTVTRGMAIILVTAIGNETQLGKIGKSLEVVNNEKTPLEKQISYFVKNMALLGMVVFLLVWAINYYRSGVFTDSLLKALTLAMSILPEEIPVAFATFMALGAWRLMKMRIVVKDIKTVETLGSASVICIDKTGTLTENTMRLVHLYTFKNRHVSNPEQEPPDDAAKELIRLAMFASEPVPFDPMEVALHGAYSASAIIDERPHYTMIHEYPLSGHPPLMTHIFEHTNGSRVIAVKGAPEALIAAVPFTSEEKEQVTRVLRELTEAGNRVLAVGEALYTGNQFPVSQLDLPFQFKGLVAFYDPPKPGIADVLRAFYQAGISVKIITGDNAATTATIAGLIGFRGADKCVSGDVLMQLPDSAVQQLAAETHVFVRMFPEAKLRIINALKASNQVVAMTGDGVNDAPALKAAHIGIAMGKRGTEIAKQAASLILLDDDLSGMVYAIGMGRRIYNNLKNAIRYIISIHIPIVLIVLVPLALGWRYPAIFSPVHIIFLELIMGPTCSIIYENEPMEESLMRQMPRPTGNTFFKWREITISMIQGLVITAGALFIYQHALSIGATEQVTRTMVFTSLNVANITLTLVNRSFYFSLLSTIRYRNKLMVWMISITLLLLIALLYMPPLLQLFEFTRLTFPQLLISTVTGILSAGWFEFIKWKTRSTDQKRLSRKQE